MRSAVHNRIPAVGCALFTVGALLGGCAGSTPSTNTRHDVVSSVSDSTRPALRGTEPVPGRSGSQAGIRVGTAAPGRPAGTVTGPARRATPATARSRAAAGCGAVLSPAWATWPMPNPKGTGLPNQARYTDLGDGSVRDDVTCLVWQRGYSAERYTWQAAGSYCAGLSIGGSGWRLPSRIELTSVMDFTRSGPAIDTSVFRGVANFFWTASPWAVRHDPPYAWVMNFYEGLTSNAGNTTNAYHARCVRAGIGSGAADYRMVATGQVQDTHTGLIWQQGGSAETMSAAQARRYCADLTLGGHGWRLPSIKELATTVDESRVAPAIDRSVFPDTAKSTYYWSSSASHPEPAMTWALNYDDGYTNYRRITAGYARCVR